MQRPKNIQMPFNFFTDVLRLVWKLEDYDLDDDIDSLCKSLESQIQTKLDAMIRREVFSKYKGAAPGSDEREDFRRQYLEMVGIHRDWISKKEITS